MPTEFAADYPRTDEGWIKFPSDTSYRKSLFFPQEVSDHPAKMNLHLQKAIIDYIAKPGDTLVDIFGGTGSLLIAALQDMYVVLLEIEDGYHQLQQRAVDNLATFKPGAERLVTLIQGDNRSILPVPCNHIITSPPYASMLKATNTKRMRERPDDEFSKQDKMMAAYTKSDRNIGKLNNFMYCLEPSTLILKSDLTWIALGKISTGDILMGVDEYPEGTYRRFRKSVVEHTSSSIIPAYRIRLSDSVTVISSSNHKWLMHGNKSSWKATHKLSIGDKIRCTFDPWETNVSYDAGYIAGMLDGEGSVDATNNSHCVRIAQRPGTVMDKCHDWLYNNNYKFSRYGHSDTNPTDQLVLTGRASSIKLLGSIRPTRLLSKSYLLWDGTTIPKDNYKEVQSIEQIGNTELIDLQTSTRTFIANGLISHNSQTMEKVYGLCYQSLEPGGTLTTILKDRMENGKRIKLTQWAVNVCTGLGMEVILWDKWDTPGQQFTQINKMHGLEVVEDEDIVILKRTA